MKHTLIAPLVIALLFVATLPDGRAANRATEAEAKALAEAAADHLRKVGPDQAFKDFEDKSGRYIDRDLYVFVQDFECTFFAHGLNPALKGRNIWNLRNPNGRYACRDIVRVTRANGAGWTRYIFQDPLTGEMAWKNTYSIGVGDYIVMVGAYSGPANDNDIESGD